MDNLTAKQRRKNMQHIKNQDTLIELKLRKKLWNKGYSVEKISNKLDCSIQTVQTRLRQGNIYNLCNYDKKLNMKNHRITNPNK